MDNLNDVSLLVMLIQSGGLSTLRTKNRLIQQEKFNERAFLERHVYLCEELLGKRIREGVLKNE